MNFLIFSSVLVLVVSTLIMSSARGYGPRVNEASTQQQHGRELNSPAQQNGRTLYAKFRNRNMRRKGKGKNKGKTNNMRKANLRLRREVHTLLNLLGDRTPNVFTSADTPATDTGASISVSSDNPNSY